MGWYANTTWDLTIRTSAAELGAAVADALIRVDPKWHQGDIDALRSSNPSLQVLIALFNEDTSDPVNIIDDKFTAWGGGKAWAVGEPPSFRPGSDYNHGGLDLYAVIAQHCTGTIDWEAEGEQWRVRFYDDGTWKTFAGHITYPGDTEGSMHAIATAIATEDTTEAHTLMCLAALDAAPTTDLLNALATHPDARVREKVTALVASAAQK